MLTRKEQKTADWLRKARYLDRELAELNEAKITAWEQATKVTTVLSGMPPAPSQEPHKLDRFVALPGNICELLEKRADARLEILNAIAGLTDSSFRTILTARYINNKPWETIAADMDRTPDTIFKNHRKALAELYAKNSDAIEEYNSKL